MKEYRLLIGESGVFGLGGPITSCGAIYIAWHEDDHCITEERGRVLLPCDEQGYRSYMKQISHYSVLRIRAKKDESTFQAEAFLEVNADPTEQEKAFLAKAALPITFTDTQFGEFVQNKSVDLFEGRLCYGNKRISVSLDDKEDLETLRWISADIDGFLEHAARYAAEKLLDLGNEWCFDAWEGEEKDFVPMTAEDFIARIRLTAISLSEDESFSLWYDDGDIFWGHAIEVDGSRAGGLRDASIQG